MSRRLDASDRAATEARPVACVGCSFDAATLLATYSPTQWDRLREGEILIEGERSEAAGGGAGSTRATGWIAQPPEHVWETLTDFESWPGFVPLVTDSEITRRAGTRAWVRQSYRVVFRSMSHTTIYDLAPRAGQLSWKLDEQLPHDIAASEGNWQFVPMDEGRATLVHYRARMDVGRAVPEFVEDMLVRQSLRNMLLQLRQEVQRVTAAADPESATAE